MKCLNVALVGNPNCGKTTLFNAYTGAKHKVGNWAGVTVEKKEAVINYKGNKLNLVDLPGVYSLTSYSIEEKITRQYLLQDDVDVIFNIVDASNLERNLYLTLQLIEIGKPVIIIMNMMDVVQRQGMEIDTVLLQKLLNVPVISVVATKKEGLNTVLDSAICLYNNKDKYIPINIPYESDIESKLSIIQKEFEDKYKQNMINSRWYSIKWLEKDSEAINEYPIEINGIELKDRENIITEEKYKFISTIMDKVLIKSTEDNLFTDRLDKFLTNKYLGIPIFLGVMFLVFFLTFNVGNIFVGYLEGLIGLVSDTTRNSLENIQVSEWLVSLIVDGIIAGVGGILVFLPNIAFLFFCMALLEDSGYMARVAYLMDHLMKKIGLSGKAFIPMILGFGCSVPAIMAARSLEDERDRLITILITPFMSCSARLPIYILFSQLFFPGKELYVTSSLYVLGIVVAIIIALIFSKTLKKGVSNPLILELPAYKLPEPKTIGIYVLEKVKGYVVKAGTVIFAASIIIWLMLNYNLTGKVEMTESIGASIGAFVAPFFSFAGFGNWQAALSLISGIAGKEIVVSNMSIIYGFSDTLNADNLLSFTDALKASGFTALSMYSFMVFSLLYTPCVGAIAAIKKETNSWKWTSFSVVFQWMVAWGVSIIVYQVGCLFC